MSDLSKHIIVVGTTAAGKSTLAIEIAKNFDREIISLDSMQIYRGMEIGTGVVPEQERNEVVHHMISTLEPTLPYSVSSFQQDVYSILKGNKEKKYVFAGGTGLYTHSVVDNFSFAPADEAVRKAVIEEFELDENNPDQLKVAQAYLYLSKIDPTAASRIDPLNVRRIIRALEAIQISNEQFSNTGTGIQTFAEPYIDCVIIGLRFSRDLLRERISTRVEEMFNSGWIEEVEKLEPIWEEMTMPAQNAIGYSPILHWIREGRSELELVNLKEHIVNKTAQFSRRQRKWFERDPRVKWIDCDELDQKQISNKLRSFL